jgi:hypothetical protein
MMLRRKNDAKKKEKPLVIPSSFAAAKRRGRARNLLFAGSHSDACGNGHSLRQAQGKLCPLPLTLMLTLLRRRAAVDFGWRSASSAAKKTCARSWASAPAFGPDNDRPHHRRRAALSAPRKVHKSTRASAPEGTSYTLSGRSAQNAPPRSSPGGAAYDSPGRKSGVSNKKGTESR